MMPVKWTGILAAAVAGTLITAAAAPAYELGQFDATKARVRSQLPFSLFSDTLNAYTINHAQGSVVFVSPDGGDSVLGIGGSGDLALLKFKDSAISVAGIGGADYFSSGSFDGVVAFGGPKLMVEGGPGNQFAGGTGVVLSISNAAHKTDADVTFFLSGRFTATEDLASYVTVLVSSGHGLLDSGFILGGVYTFSDQLAAGFEIEDIGNTGFTPYARWTLGKLLQVGAGLTFADGIKIQFEGEVTVFLDPWFAS